MELGNLSCLKIAAKGTIAVEKGNRLYACLKDHRGSILTLLDEENKIIATYDYSAFGETSQTGMDCPWRFCAQRQDPLTGLYHFPKRVYVPETGRWLTPDPLGFADGPNLYAYVKNNPLNFIDPTGLFAEPLKQFFYSAVRGAIDDTFMGATNHWLGEYQCHSNASKNGYATGVLLSTAASFFYGGAEAKLIACCGKSLARANRFFESGKAVKSLAQTKNVVKLTEKASPTTQKTADFLKKAKFFKKNERCAPDLGKIKYDINEWLGKGSRVLKNKSNDPIFMSECGTRRVRFDFNNPHGDIPHIHIEHKPMNRWKDASNKHRIYPMEM